MPLSSKSRAGASTHGSKLGKISPVEQVFCRYYKVLLPAMKACLAVFAGLSLAKRTRPLALILESASGYGKTAILQSTFPTAVAQLENYIYRCDKFTPKAFVTHASNVPRARLPTIDLLPRLRDKVLVTKELAPIFRGREAELIENFATLISVLDGKGFVSDSGVQGRRGYPAPIMFNWVGATTPLPRETHRLMAQLGTRLLFYEVPTIQPTEAELLAYARSDDPSKAEEECTRAVNSFLCDFFQHHPVGSVPPESIHISIKLPRALVHWAEFLVAARREVRYEKAYGEREPVGAGTPEAAWKVVNYFKELARGHALIHGRDEVDGTDLELIGHVAISSIPGHLRPIVRELRQADTVDSTRCAELCGVSAPTARNYLQELALLGIVALAKGSAQTKAADSITLTPRYKWLRQRP